MHNTINRYSIQSSIYRFFWKAVDFVYPPVCSGCGVEGTLWCENCQSSVHRIAGDICPRCGKYVPGGQLCQECATNPPPFSALRSWAWYEGPLRESLIHLKYHSNIGMGLIFAKPLLEIISAEDWTPDLVIPVPLSKAHLKARGFNQAEVIARPLSLALQIPLETNAVIRKKDTHSQVKLSKEERFKNLQSAFLGNFDKLISKKVLLVDDITTTGATLTSCSQALIDAGCEKVYCLTVAHTPDPRQKIF